MAEAFLPTHKRFHNLTGQTFGRLTVQSHQGSNRFHQSVWLCDCECGETSVVVGSQLLNGRTKSCGCLRRDNVILRFTKHGAATGGTKLPELAAWIQMNQRCFNPRCANFRHYGGRGITVCDRWRHSFQNFIDDMGLRPSSKHSIDRFPDRNGNYEKSNCRWATSKEQQRNKRTNLHITFNGETLCLAEWSEKTGIHVNTLWLRLKLGQTGDRLFRPIDTRFSSRYWTR